MAQAQGAGSGTAGDRSPAGLVGRAFGRLGRVGGLVFLLAGLEYDYGIRHYDRRGIDYTMCFTKV
ncbi:hypothetical protein ABZ499_34060 [Streptomyces sp. NPDC019990]|uniref:hypothetical protein n=1 Tax=Streptomyces sp. NPDC019990 TaxID=3154693 RepID=UPI0033C7658D